jgi:hypothetical protein
MFNGRYIAGKTCKGLAARLTQARCHSCLLRGILDGQQRRADMSRTTPPLHCYCVRTSEAVVVTECAKCHLAKCSCEHGGATRLRTTWYRNDSDLTSLTLLHKTVTLESFECLPVTVANKYTWYTWRLQPILNTFYHVTTPQTLNHHYTNNTLAELILHHAVSQN